jgi:hypothetical protein
MACPLIVLRGPSHAPVGAHKNARRRSRMIRGVHQITKWRWRCTREAGDGDEARAVHLRIGAGGGDQGRQPGGAARRVCGDRCLSLARPRRGGAECLVWQRLRRLEPALYVRPLLDCPPPPSALVLWCFVFQCFGALY